MGARRREGREESRVGVDEAEVGRGGLTATGERLGNTVPSGRPLPLCRPLGEVLDTVTGLFKTDSTSRLSKDSTALGRDGEEAEFWREVAREEKVLPSVVRCCCLLPCLPLPSKDAGSVCSWLSTESTTP